MICVTAYLDQKSYLLVDTPKRIAARYISAWFIFDVCSTIPYQPFGLLFKKHANGLAYRMLDMLRLWRLRRLSALFARLEKDIRLNYYWIRCIKLISVSVYVPLNMIHISIYASIEETYSVLLSKICRLLFLQYIVQDASIT